jgi:hypothetical protein
VTQNSASHAQGPAEKSIPPVVNAFNLMNPDAESATGLYTRRPTKSIPYQIENRIT